MPRFSLTVIPERQPSWERLWERPALRTVTQALGRGMGEILGEIPPHRLACSGVNCQELAGWKAVLAMLFGEDPRLLLASHRKVKASFGSR
jgi:hypothetical protein